jgi:hypothetical protein
MYQSSSCAINWCYAQIHQCHKPIQLKDKPIQLKDEETEVNTNKGWGNGSKYK